MRRIIAVVAAIMAASRLVCGTPASADEAAVETTAANLAAGTLATGESALTAIIESDPGNDEARMGLGVVRFVAAIEHLSQGLYRYGLQAPESMLLPVLSLPVPPNPSPEPITYDDFRGLIQSFVNDLGSVDETLAGVTSADAKLPLDLAMIRYDADGDGNAGADENLLAVVQRVTGMEPEDMPADLTFAFDRGDALWLRGYSNVLMALGEFLLAHDWQESFDDAFFHFFPAMRSPFRDALAAPGAGMEGEVVTIADVISFFHIRWPVAEPARMTAVLAHLKAMTTLSRQSWEAILAETDDDREWLPSPSQTGPFVSVVVDAESVAAWQVVLNEVDAILDGRKLVPHWRFRQGFNLRRVFEEPRPFDFVLWVTGPAALPYLEDGPVATLEEWRAITDAFGDNFVLFAIWAN